MITAKGGMEGLEKAREERPDLIVLDIMMPKLDGYQICRMLKFDKTTKNMPIIMLTALSQEDDKYWGKEVRADAYITKPFDPADLLEKIKSIIES